jgi:hypothetical protein
MCRQKIPNEQPNALRAVKCRESLAEYCMYVRAEGRDLNSGDLTRIDRALYRRILKRFGSWNNFRSHLDGAGSIGERIKDQDLP